MIHLASPLLGLLAASPAAHPAPAADPPRIFNHMVKAARLRPTSELQVGGRAMTSMAVFSELPFLLWFQPDAAEGIDRTPEAVRRWLVSAGPALGHGELAPVFEERAPWLGVAETWIYRLEHEGVPVWGYSVQVFWQGSRLVGLTNDLLGPTAGVERFATDVPSDQRVLLPRRDADGRVLLEAAQRTQREIDGQTVTLVAGAQQSFQSTTVAVAGGRTATGVTGAVWGEWPLPGGFGSFPDQIDTDSQGRVWFSQPNSDQITRFDPATETFTKYPMTGGSGPDGLMVSSSDLVYTGLYYSGALGVFDPVTGTHSSYPAPFSPAAMAIPTETDTGTVICTDHSGKVAEWDPTTQQWLQVVNTPTSSPHIVAGVTGEPGIMWFTEYNANQLARLDVASGVMTEIDVPGGGGPAFPAYSHGRVWFSLWNKAQQGYYDVATGQFVFYTYSVGNELGGPIFTAPNGDVACATRNSGYVMVHRRALDEVEAFKIPTSFPGMKDGLTVDASGAVWITESGMNKIARLKYPH